jgi:hypothetical protein
MCDEERVGEATLVRGELSPQGAKDVGKKRDRLRAGDRAGMELDLGGNREPADQALL